MTSVTGCFAPRHARRAGIVRSSLFERSPPTRRRASCALGMQRLEPRARFVEALSGGGLVVLRDRRERFLKRFDAPLAIAEERDARGFERVGVGGVGERGEPVALDALSASSR